MKAIALIATFLPLQAVAQASFVTIGDLPGGSHTSQTRSTSADGSVVSGLSSASNATLAFRWTRATGISALPQLPGTTNYQGGAVSPDGTFISGIHGIPNQQAQLGFVWSNQTGMMSVGSLPGGRDITNISFVTNEGLAVGQSDFDFTSTGAPLYRAIRWTPQGGLETLPLPEPTDLQFQSRALSVLDDGRIYGVSNSGNWLYSESSGFEILPVGSYMRRINSSGDFLIGTMLDFSTQIPHRAKYWTPDTGEVSLAPYGDDYASEALYMSDDGSTIIGRGTLGWQVWVDQDAPVLFDDFIASNGVDLGDWQISFIHGISADGLTIHGTATNISGLGVLTEGFVITIPSPASAFPLTLALFATRRKR